MSARPWRIRRLLVGAGLSVALAAAGAACGSSTTTKNPTSHPGKPAHVEHTTSTTAPSNGGASF